MGLQAITETPARSPVLISIAARRPLQRVSIFCIELVFAQLIGASEIQLYLLSIVSLAPTEGSQDTL
jgi:hypothetical protein